MPLAPIPATSSVFIIMFNAQFHRIPISYLLLKLTVADMLYATFIAPKVFVRHISINHPKGMTGAVLYKLLTGRTVTWIGATSSIVTLAADAIERYYAVMYPLGNRGKLTKRKLKVSSAVTT